MLPFNISASSCIMILQIDSYIRSRDHSRIENMATSKEYKCERCGYTTHLKSTLRGHLLRKNVCDPVQSDVSVQELIQKLDTVVQKKYVCTCGKSYSNRQGLYVHRRTNCGKQKEPIKRPSTKNSNKEIIEKMVDFMSTMTDLLKGLTDKQNNVTYNTADTIYNTKSTQNNIYLVNFGHERMDHIDEKFLDECLDDINTAIPKLYEKVLELPENRNIRNKNTEAKLMEVVENNKWVPISRNDALNRILHNQRRILYNHHLETSQEDLLDPRQMNEKKIYTDNAFQDMLKLTGRRCIHIRDDIFGVIRKKELEDLDMEFVLKVNDDE